MATSRRHFVQLFSGAAIASQLCSRLCAEPPLFEVDRLAGECLAYRPLASQRRYQASAHISLFSIPLISKSGVGSGFAVVEDASEPAGNTVAIQFGAGSFPDSARGLNRLGFIQEVVRESAVGDVQACAYLAFMTSSQEKNLEQAKAALEQSGSQIAYVASEGKGRAGVFSSRLERLSFPSQTTWRDYPTLLAKVRTALASDQPAECTSKQLASTDQAPATFLYAIRKALVATDTHTNQPIVYNGKELLLTTTRKPDPEAGARFAKRNLVQSRGRVMRLDATVRDHATGHLTPFRVWFESGAEQLPPLCFEYQPKSFLRLTFEFDPTAAGPPIGLALHKRQTEGSAN